MKKHCARLTSLLLVVLMLLGLAVTAFAEGPTTGSITIDNPKDGATYTAYKIFDVVYTTDKQSYAYTITSSSEWYTDVSAYTDLELVASLENPDTYTVFTKNNFSASAFAAYLKTKINGKTSVPLNKDQNGKTTVAELPLGYYLVAGAQDALCSLTTTAPDASIHDKSNIPFDKTVDKKKPQLGEDVTFTITGTVPSTEGFEKYTYLIKDTMSEGLTYLPETLTVTVGGQNYSVTPKTVGNGFELPIDVMNLNVNDPIVVTYKARVNENAVAKVSENKAELHYSNDPTNTQATETITDKERVYTAKIVVDKYIQGNSDQKLAGAEFVLAKGDKNNREYYVGNSNGGQTITGVTWTNNLQAATHLTTDSDGAVTFPGLSAGTYYLIETKAPEGYNLLKEPVEVTVNAIDDMDLMKSEAELKTSLTVKQGVENSKGALLPSTGGIGTTIFYVLGGLLAVGAAVLLVTKRRMSTGK